MQSLRDEGIGVITGGQTSTRCRSFVSQELKASAVVLFLSQVSPKVQAAVPPRKQASLEAALLEALLDLVDRYWSGCKSLHGNEVFLGESGGDGQLVTATPAQVPPLGSIAGPSSSAITWLLCCGAHPRVPHRGRGLA